MVYKLSYLDEKKIWSILDPYQKKGQKIRSFKVMEVYTPVESPCQI
jgi:hypothetical protein